MMAKQTKKSTTNKTGLYIAMGALALTLIFLIISIFAAALIMFVLSLILMVVTIISIVVSLKNLSSKVSAQATIGIVALVCLFLIIGLFIAGLIMVILSLLAIVGALICTGVSISKN